MDSDPKLLPRDKLLRDTFTPAETLLFALILLVANVAFWLADPRSYWLLGFFLIAAAVSVVVLKTHQHTHPFFVTFLWRKFWLCTAPVWLLLLQFVVGIWQQPLATLQLDRVDFVQFTIPPGYWLPVSTSPESAWVVVLGFGAMPIVAVGLFIVPKSRAFFEQLMPWLCLSAVLVSLIGYLQKGLDVTKPMLTKGTGASDFFAFFPYDGHWAAFAILWTCACLSMALLTTRYEDSPPFFESSGPWYLTGGTLLAGTAFLVEARWPATLLILTYAAMMALLSWHFFQASKDPHRKTIACLSGLVSVGMTAAGLFRIFQTTSHPTADEHLRQAVWAMFRDRPIFGWGMDSFGHLFPFYSSDLLLGENYERAGSDALQLLAEFGILGLIPSILLLAILLGRYFMARRDIQLTHHLLLGLAATLILGFLDSPFMSPAVFFSFVVLTFIALRWADVTRYRADEVDAPRPTLVTPHNLRRVPFHAKPTGEKYK